MLQEKDIYRIFDELNIEYKVLQHEAVYTIDAAKENFEITFTMPAVMGGMTVTIRPGTAPAQ